jgi:hypothetical protein
VGEEVGDLGAGERDGGVAQRRDDRLSSAQSGLELFGRDLVQRGVVARPSLDLLGEPVELLSPLWIVFGEILEANDQEVDVALRVTVCSRCGTEDGDVDRLCRAGSNPLP